MLHRVHHGHRFSLGAHQDSPERGARHRVRNPDFRLNRLLQPAVLHVRYEPDNLKHRLFHRVFKLFQLRDANLLPDWIVVPQILAHKGLIHDRQLLRSVDFRFRERPAIHELNLQHRKVSRAAQLKHCVPFVGVRLSWNLDVARDSSIRRERTRFRGFDDTGQGLEPLKQWAVKSRNLSRCFVSVHGQGKPGHQNVIGAQSQLHVPQRYKTAH